MDLFQINESSQEFLYLIVIVYTHYVMHTTQNRRFIIE